MNQIDTINVLGISFLVVGQGYDTPKPKLNQIFCLSGLMGKLPGLWKCNISLPDTYSCLPGLNKTEYKYGYLVKWHLGNVVFSQKGFKPDQQDVNKFSREFVSILI